MAARRPRWRAAPTCRAAPNQVPANVGAVVASATRLLQAIPGNDLNKLIGELATSLSGQAGNLRTLISAGTTFSKEFVAYQQQFTELLANAPPVPRCDHRRRARAAPGPGQHRGTRPGPGPAEVGAAHLADVGLVGLQRGGQPRDVAVGQPGLLPARHGRHPLQHRAAHQPDQPVAGAGVQPVLLRRGRPDRRARGWPSPPRRTRRRTRTRRSCAHGSCCPRSSTSRRSPTARRTPSPTRSPARGA